MFQVIVAYGTMNIEKMLTQAAAQASDDRLVIAIGIVRAPFTKSWHVGLSRNGGPLSWVSGHQRKRDAERQIALVRQAGRVHDLGDDSAFARLSQELAGHSDVVNVDAGAEPRVLSQERPPATAVMLQAHI